MNLCFITDFSESRNQSGFDRVFEREFRRVSAEFWQIVANYSSAPQFTDTFTDSGQSGASKPLPHTRLRMEPVAGLGPAPEKSQNDFAQVTQFWYSAHSTPFKTVGRNPEESHRHWIFDRRMRVVAGDFKILELILED